VEHFGAAMLRDRRCGVAENKAKDRQHDENSDDLHKAHATQYFLIVSFRLKTGGAKAVLH